MNKLIPIERIENKIYLIRGQKVMLDYDLAKLYGVKTFVMNQSAKRNKKRFPVDFVFQLKEDELKNLTSQIVISSLPAARHGKTGWGGRRRPPYAFTEQGVAMLSSVLNSERAILVNVAIMRTFVKLRKILATHKDLAHQLAELEGRVEKNELETKEVFAAIRQLMAPPEKPKRRIGFLADRGDS